MEIFTAVDFVFLSLIVVKTREIVFLIQVLVQPSLEDHQLQFGLGLKGRSRCSEAHGKHSASQCSLIRRVTRWRFLHGRMPVGLPARDVHSCLGTRKSQYHQNPWLTMKHTSQEACPCLLQFRARVPHKRFVEAVACVPLNNSPLNSFIRRG
jgi:hypothetical protein